MHIELTPRDFSFQPDNTEFSNISFTGFDLSYSDLGLYEFCNCKFISCNLSMVKLNNTLMDGVEFVNCKLMGVDFSKCSRYVFTVRFTKSVMSYSLFERNRMAKSVFHGCVIHEASFSDTDLSEAKFIDCDLSLTQFTACNLTRCDFRSSVNYCINPAVNKVKKARFSYDQIVGLLSSYDIIIE